MVTTTPLKTQAPRSYNCLVTLTVPNSFEELDQALVDAISEICPGSQAYVYKGAYKKSGKENKLSACTMPNDNKKTAFKHSQIIPTTTEHNRTPIRSIVINTDTIIGNNLLLNSALAIYKNQISHITQASLDKLTGLLTRDLFEFYLQHIYKDIKQAKRRNTDKPKQYAVAFLDIDDFKRVNDQHGHLIGDEVLLLISQLMKHTFRTEDLLFRFGGEEFIVILNNCDLDTCHFVLERFRSKIEEHTFPLINHITVSIGFSLINSDYSYDTLLNQADKALYYAKEHGKNMSCNYEELVDKNLIEPLSNLEGDVELF